ncbi:uncharacterized protein MONOS_8285 [Monocercomonoides exilis]|uniref:uncharacterized protein n=1 Tax=Monocercomonoides exilis TaxID=2049356 RepID=UPI003559CCD9|nr:hypothetical protein MONOS_8285 [Monocercomonoides exilis]|eukprot:MONOS_8285.1-p1 / transcript=MONOS_8285.1 / gene=MONOS_8285 / organism=Monocercomonoides_exilis_PA203 / gene_product=unspecified product / transcript_product=unspecified product / location=Mono_scaffold00308:53131-54471(-) / protein_length=447 / sequence_SO=supercontig / SO=protein_coding / is_pseudo=false
MLCDFYQNMECGVYFKVLQSGIYTEAVEAELERMFSVFSSSQGQRKKANISTKKSDWHNSEEWEEVQYYSSVYQQSDKAEGFSSRLQHSKNAAQQPPQLQKGDTENEQPKSAAEATGAAQCSAHSASLDMPDKADDFDSQSQSAFQMPEDPVRKALIYFVVYSCAYAAHLGCVPATSNETQRRPFEAAFYKLETAQLKQYKQKAAAERTYTLMASQPLVPLTLSAVRAKVALEIRSMKQQQQALNVWSPFEGIIKIADIYPIKPTVVREYIDSALQLLDAIIAFIQHASGNKKLARLFAFGQQDYEFLSSLVEQRQRDRFHVSPDGEISGAEEPPLSPSSPSSSSNEFCETPSLAIVSVPTTEPAPRLTFCAADDANTAEFSFACALADSAVQPASDDKATAAAATTTITTTTTVSAAATCSESPSLHPLAPFALLYSFCSFRPIG